MFLALYHIDMILPLQKKYMVSEIFVTNHLYDMSCIMFSGNIRSGYFALL